MENKTKIKSIFIGILSYKRLFTLTVNLIQKHKNFFTYSFFSFLIIGLGCDVSFAAESTTSAGGQTTLSGFMDILNYLLAGIGTILGVLTGLVALFLNPGWVNGEIFGLTQYLKEMWILVSNVVYFIFAGILITIAFMNIIGKGGDKFELKQALPKFIVGILIVPFSWFIVQFILSISAILTVSVLSLPYDTFYSSIGSEKLDKPIQDFCPSRNFNMQSGDATSKSNYDLDIKAGIDKTTAKEHSGYKETFECTDTNYITLKQIIGGTDGKTQQLYGIIGIYSFAVMEIGDLDILKSKQLSTINSLLSLSAKTLFDIVFILMYVILLAALFLALFVRGIMLWLYAMLSPLFGLTYFLGDKGGESLKKFNFKELFSLAMVPVLVSAALSFGLLFLLVAGHGLSINPVDSTSGGAYINKDGMNLGFMKINFIGAAGGGGTTNSDGGGPISIFFNGATNVVGWLIIKIFGLVLLWMAVMAALNSSTITKAIIEPIDKFGKSVGTLAMSAPKYIPIPGTGGLSAEGLASAGGTISSAIQNRATSKGTDWAQSKFPGLFEGEKEYVKAMNELRNVNDTNKKDVIDKVMALLRTKDQKTLSQRGDALNEVATRLEKTGIIDEAHAAGIRNAKDQESLEEALHQANLNSKGKYGQYFLGAQTVKNDDVPGLISNKGSTTNNVSININNLKEGNIELTDTNGKIAKGQGEKLGEYLIGLKAFRSGDYDDKKISDLFDGDKDDMEKLIKYLKDNNFGKSKDGNKTTPPTQ